MIPALLALLAMQFGGGALTETNRRHYRSIVAGGTASEAPFVTGGTATLTVGMTYNAQYPAWDIIATGTPTTYGATGTPPGIYVSGSQLLGTATGTGTNTVILSASNAAGTGTVGLTMVVQPQSSGRTFYVDFDSGTLTASGTSKSVPMKLAPTMAIGTGAVPNYYTQQTSYTHQAGDRFIFKGGVTWPRAYLYINAGYQGTAGNRDYYGVDPTWYTGGSWTRPVFDGEFVDHWMVDTHELTGYYEIEGIHFTRIAFGTSYYNTGHHIVAHASNQQDVVFRNIKVSNWTVGTGLDGAHGGMTGYAANGTNQLTVLYDGVEVENSAQGGSGNCVRWGGVMRRCKIHDNSSAVLYAVELDGCEIYSIDGVANDGVYHPNGAYMDPWTFPGLGTVTIKNSIFRDIGGGANMAYPQPRGGGTCYVLNNLFYGTMSAQSAIEADPYNYGSGNQTGVLHVYNNTIVMDPAQFPSGGHAILFVDRTSEGSKVGNAYVFNNHVIGPTGTTLSNQSGTYVVTFSSGNSVIETTTQAGTAGVVIGSLYRPAGGPTLGTGTALTGTFTTDRLYRERGGTWDIGAYKQ